MAGPSLPTPEALTSLDSLWASFRAGGASFEEQIRAARAFATHDERLVATFLPFEIMTHVKRSGSAADIAAARAFVRGLAVARLDRLGVDPARGSHGSDSTEKRQLRQSLVLMAFAEEAISVFRFSTDPVPAVSYLNVALPINA